MTRNPFHVDQKRFDPGKWLMIGAFFLLTLQLSYLLVLRPSSDMSIHTTWAGEGDFRDPFTFVRHVAHPLWHAMVAFVRLFGIELYPAATLVTALCKAAEVWLIHRLLTVGLEDRCSRSAITLITAVCATVASVCVPFFNPTVYVGAGTPNTWHSPTQLLSMVSMFLCVPYTAYCFDRFVELEPAHGKNTLLPWREPIVLGVFLLFSAVAKPTFMQAFLPAACLFFLVQWIHYPHNSRYFFQIILCVLPSVLYIILEYLFYFGIIVPWGASMVLEINAEKFLYTGIRALLTLAFPFYTLYSCRDQKKDTVFYLTLVFNAVAIVEYLILGENGRRAGDGNFGWGMMGAALMMWVVALIRFFRAEKRHWIGWTLLAWHLASGVYYIVYLFVSGSSL